MKEDDARQAVRDRTGMDGYARLQALAELVESENQRQNLVAPATTAVMWARHILDSIQLLDLVPLNWTRWLDIGTGGGFPGLAIAAATQRVVTLVEPRRGRAEFLANAAAVLKLGNVTVFRSRVEQITQQADIISARAVGSLEKLLLAANQCATATTTWVLPRGRMHSDELEQVRRSWKGLFHVERSLTDSSSMIVVASGVEAR